MVGKSTWVNSLMYFGICQLVVCQCEAMLSDEFLIEGMYWMEMTLKYKLISCL